MQRSSNDPRASTSDLLTWPELPPPESSPAVTASGDRSRQPSDKIGEVLRGSQLTEEEAQTLVKKKQYSGYKTKEMTGSGIFSAIAEDTTSGDSSANLKGRTGIRVYQQAVNQISFSTEEIITPKKPNSLAKQRELSGTFSEPDSKTKKQISSAKTKELSGNDIFGPSPEIKPRSFIAPRTSDSKENKDLIEPFPQNVSTSVKVSNPAGGQINNIFGEETVKKATKKIHDQKFAELTGNNIFKGDVPPGSAKNPTSRAKLREMAGSDIFADGKAENRGRGGCRPPGGGSSISLV